MRARRVRVGAAVALALLVASVMLTVTPAPAAAQTPAELPPDLQARATALYDRILCPICTGQTLRHSQSTLAKQMRGVIQEKLLAGETDDAIVAYFVSVYDESVLAAPPWHGIGLAAWFVPPIGIAAGALVVYLVIRSLRRRTTPLQAATPAPVPPAGLAPYLQAVDSELAQDGVRE